MIPYDNGRVVTCDAACSGYGGLCRDGAAPRCWSPTPRGWRRACALRALYERLSNDSVVGRTGRGDTTFAAYLSHRLDHDPAASLKLAAALVSIKMESTGPFRGTLEDVERRIRERHR